MQAIPIRISRCSRRQIITPSERRVLALLAQGYTSKQIAKVLDISVSTVGAHRSRVMRKMGITSPQDLRQFSKGYIALCQKQGLPLLVFDYAQDRGT